MAYTLEAFVMPSVAAGEAIKQFSSALAVPLAHGMSLTPLTRDFIADLDSGCRSGVGYEFADLPALAPCAAEWAARTSRLTQIAFVEAEFFGGLGSQAAIGWQAGQLAFGPLQAKDAINQVLHWLGIVPARQAEEFDALQLGRYRSTQDWTKV